MSEGEQAKETFPKGLILFSITLFVILALLLWYSKREESYRICSVEIKQSTVIDFFEPVYPLYGYKGILFDMEHNTEIDTSSHKILIAGDSMSALLALRLNDYCKHNGHTMYSLVWNSGNTQWFANTDTLDYFIQLHQPTYIIIVLGSNELQLWKPESRRKEIEQIIAKIGNIPYVWVGPPNWIEDTGINNVLLQSVGRKRFFPSKNLQYSRLSDGAHPDKKSSFMWLDSIASFIMSKSKFPILLNEPDTMYSKYPPTSVLDPLYARKNNKTIRPELILDEIGNPEE
jgi:hypothetical protein